MFIDMFSDYEYPQSEWPQVFHLELSIQAIVREFWQEMVDVDDIVLRNELMAHLSAAGVLARCEASVVNAFLNRETPCVAAVVQELNAAGVCDIEARHPRFSLKMDVFRSSLKESPAFKAFVISQKAAPYPPVDLGGGADRGAVGKD